MNQQRPSHLFGIFLSLITSLLLVSCLDSSITSSGPETGDPASVGSSEFASSDDNDPVDDDDSGDSGDDDATGDPGDDDPFWGPPDPNDPPEHVHGPITIWATDDGVSTPNVIVDNGDGTFTTYSNPSSNVLAFAMKLAKPGDVIALKGQFPAVAIGLTFSFADSEVFWPGGQVIRDITIIAADPADPPTINGLTFRGDMTTGQGGVDNIYFKNVIVRNGGDNRTPIIIFQGSLLGRIGLYDITYVTVNPSLYGGYGMKWGLRGHGRALYDVRRNIFTATAVGSAEEHAIYIDSPGWNGAGDSYILDLVQQGPSGRTCIQVVNRKNEGPTGLGLLMMKRIVARTKKGAGGSALTIAGHLGPVYMEDIYYKGDLGAITFWSDAGKGLHTVKIDGKDFTTPYAELRNVYIDATNADRSHIALAGVGTAIIGAFTIIGNRTAFDLWNNFSGPLDNGDVWFDVTAPVSAYPGFQSAQKIKYKGSSLSDAAIDAMLYQP